MTADMVDECNDFVFITGFIMFPEALNTTTGVVDEDRAITLALELMTKYSPAELRKLFHAPAVAILTNSPPGDFSFCDNKCVIVALKSLDVSDTFSINTNFVSLPLGACRNSFGNENW